jgi:hypothetical protein
MESSWGSTDLEYCKLAGHKLGCTETGAVTALVAGPAPLRKLLINLDRLDLAMKAATTEGRIVGSEKDILHCKTVSWHSSLDILSADALDCLLYKNS